MSDTAPPPIRLTDYRPPAWTITDVALVFDLERESSAVEATLVASILNAVPAAPKVEVSLDVTFN